MKILVIGEKCKDRFIYCNTERFCPEAPVPILLPISVEENDGMSGNVVRNINSINPNLEIIHFFQTSEIVKTRFIEKKSNHMFLRFDEGELGVDHFILDEHKINIIKNVDLVIVSDYNKGFLNKSDLFFLGKNSKLSILDTKRKICDDISEVFTFVKLNQKEFTNNKHLKNFSNILITLGQFGCEFMGKKYPVNDIKETIDVSGAGDSFTVAFILKFLETRNIENSIIYANQIASLVVTKKGVSVPF